MAQIRDSDLLNKIGSRLKELREGKGLTLEALSHEVELEISQLHRIEKGKLNASISTLSQICKGLGISLSKFLEGL